MRWSRRDEPCGSHHVEAREEKCEISEEETDDDEEVDKNRMDWCERGFMVCKRRTAAIREIDIVDSQCSRNRNTANNFMGVNLVDFYFLLYIFKRDCIYKISLSIMMV